LPLLVAVSGCRFWLPFGSPKSSRGIMLPDFKQIEGLNRIEGLIPEFQT